MFANFFKHIHKAEIQLFKFHENRNVKQRFVKILYRESSILLKTAYPRCNTKICEHQLYRKKFSTSCFSTKIEFCKRKGKP